MHARRRDLTDHDLPDWSRVKNCHFDTWAEDRIVLDASKLPVAEGVICTREAMALP